jgi:hypothetical protein
MRIRSGMTKRQAVWDVPIDMAKVNHPRFQGRMPGRAHEKYQL